MDFFRISVDDPFNFVFLEFMLQWNKTNFNAPNNGGSKGNSFDTIKIDMVLQILNKLSNNYIAVFIQRMEKKPSRNSISVDAKYVHNTGSYSTALFNLIYSKVVLCKWWTDFSYLGSFYSFQNLYFEAVSSIPLEAVRQERIHTHTHIHQPTAASEKCHGTKKITWLMIELSLIRPCKHGCIYYVSLSKFQKIFSLGTVLLKVAKL